MSSAESPSRQRCYTCFRPIGDCYCATLPAIANRTEVLILQHRREQFHPFNTARIVRQALRNSTLLADHTNRLVERLRFKPRAGLLYPGSGARLLTDVPRDEWPAQLVVVDGTWHQAKTLVRDIDALAALPRFRLAPAEPSNYRIRREPNATALSTVEAVVAALRLLEPETQGLEQLLAAFQCMVDRQLAHPRAELDGRRCRARRRRTLRNIPIALATGLSRVVVAYGERPPAERGVCHSQPAPLVWVAQRPVSGERFGSTIRPHALVDDHLLCHFELAAADFAGAPPLDEVRAAWHAFLRPEDLLVVYGPSTARLAARLSGEESPPCLVLKSIDFNPDRRYGTLDELVVGEQLVVEPSGRFGRAGRRLANAVALVRHLHALAASTP